MSNIKRAFEKGKAFIGFITAGDPSIEKTEKFILEMVEAGADLIEIGIPFSDPVAEGPIIQDADRRSLAAGTTVDKIFDMVVSIRKKTDIPMVFMSYLNPVFRYGYEKFFAKSKAVGMDGIILPDLPFEEKGEVETVADEYGIPVISMIAPTSEQRIQEITSQAKGFLYVVSSMGVTGVRSEIKTDLQSIMDVVKKTSSIPAAIGFGINTPKQAENYSAMCDGVIVGSAIVKIIAEYGGEAGPYIYQYVKTMKDALRA